MKKLSLPVAVLLCVVGPAAAQNTTSERTFSQSASAVQAAVKKLPGGTSGSLPILEGFVLPGSHPLEQYKRPFYQCTVVVTPAASGGSRVKVIAKITAWRDGSSRPGYEILGSNGRLESDLLDRLQDALLSASANKSEAAQSDKAEDRTTNSSAPEISAPMPQLPRSSVFAPPTVSSGKSDPQLQQEANNLEEILRNEAHPTNLLAVKRNQTPVLQDPSANAKVLFLASAEDEFEVLDVNPEWVHVRISGLSRGWLRRSSVELLDGSEKVDGSENATRAESLGASNASSAGKTSPPLFSVSSEETGAFPGDWEALKGKSVKIISVQQAAGSGRITSPQDKMRFAESVFKNEDVSAPAEGLVLIFDAEDGGMVAASRPILDQWKHGAISEPIFWKSCFFDPPEILGSLN